mmetsp:Transcript_10966/g.19150  ORF Transcript_10966/g.19150 Transcript_10966/m.19150 type:complete len:472 (-) Transcript_10966:381-1796(-)
MHLSFASCDSCTTSLLVLSHCQHSSCKTCFTKCIEQIETSRNITSPTCPFCRVAIAEADILTILGRPFQQRRLSSGKINGQDTDYLTLQWLDANTKRCEGCGSQIEKTRGCNLIECLCGWKFCYNCGSPGGRCNCNRDHRFLSNLVVDSPIVINGLVDMRSCIIRREVRQKRVWRTQHTKAEENSRWDYTVKNAATCTSSGKWLFSSRKSNNSIRMLVQQLEYQKIHQNKRQESRKTRSPPHEAEDLDLTWLFPGQHSFWDYDEQLRRQTLRAEARKQHRKECARHWRYFEKRPSVCTTNGRWIFSCKTNVGSSKMLGMQLISSTAQFHRKKDRTRTRKQETNGWEWSNKRTLACTINGRWLFSTKTNAGSIRMLCQQLNMLRINLERQSKRANIGSPPQSSLNIFWLFLPTAESRIALKQAIIRDIFFERRRLNHVEDMKKWRNERKLELAHYLEGVMDRIERKFLIPKE